MVQSKKKFQEPEAISTRNLKQEPRMTRMGTDEKGFRRRGAEKIFPEVFLFPTAFIRVIRGFNIGVRVQNSPLGLKMIL